MAASGQVKVVRRADAFFACVGQHRTDYLTLNVGDDGEESFDVGDFTIAGRWIAWVETDRARDNVYFVRACKADSRDAVLIGEDFNADALSTTRVPVRRLLVNNRGGLAWYAYTSDAGPPSAVLRIADSAGERIVATGSDLNPDSIAIAPNSAYWNFAGTPTSMPLLGAVPTIPGRPRCRNV